MALDDLAPDVDDKELRVEAPLAKAEPPEPKAEPKPEPKAEVKEEKTEPQEKVKMVPHEALHEERIKRKELAARLEAKEKADAEYRASIEAKLARLTNPPPPKPDVEKEPVRALQHDIGETRELIKPLAERLNTFEQGQRRMAAEADIANRTVASEVEFLKKNTDYHDAVAHLQKVADLNLQAMGIDDPVQRANLIKQQSLGLAHQALQAGKSPAEVAYQLAKNYGYQGKKPEPAAEEKKLETIAKGQQESKSLGGGGATKTGGAITLEQLERMSDEEIDELIANDKEWNKLVRQMQ